MSRDNRRIPCTACGRSKEVRDTVDARTYVCANCGRSSALIVPVDDPRWRLNAACRTPEALLTMDLAGDGHAPSVRDAKELCGYCQVTDACLAAAIDTERNGNSYRWGVRGGLTALERYELHKQNGRATA